MDNFYSDTPNPRSNTQSTCLNYGTVSQICCVYVTLLTRPWCHQPRATLFPQKLMLMDFLPGISLPPTSYFKNKIEQLLIQNNQWPVFPAKYTLV